MKKLTDLDLKKSTAAGWARISASATARPWKCGTPHRSARPSAQKRGILQITTTLRRRRQQRARVLLPRPARLRRPFRFLHETSPMRGSTSFPLNTASIGGAATACPRSTPPISIWSTASPRRRAGASRRTEPSSPDRLAGRSSATSGACCPARHLPRRPPCGDCRARLARRRRGGRRQVRRRHDQRRVLRSERAKDH